MALVKTEIDGGNVTDVNEMDESIGETGMVGTVDEPVEVSLLSSSEEDVTAGSVLMEMEMLLMTIGIDVLLSLSLMTEDELLGCKSQQIPNST